MIAISSHRPHQGEDEYRLNQVRAKESWDRFFEKVIYFGPYEAELANGNTEFVASEDFPRIKDVALLASKQMKVVTLINADIVVNKRLFGVEERVLKGRWKGAVSRRRHYDPKTFNLEQAYDDPKDRGRDIFVAHPTTWAVIHREIPDVLRFGHQWWDTFVCDYWRDHYSSRYADFTALNCVFHPIHGNRRMPHSGEISNIAKW